MVEQQWMEWLAPHFARYGVQPASRLREIYASFVVDEAMQQALLDARPAVLSFYFGLPSSDMIESHKRAGIKLLASATSVDEVRRVAEGKVEVDAIVVQG